VSSDHQPCRQFFIPGLQKNEQGTVSQGNRHCLWQDSDKGVDLKLMSPESIRHQTIIIMNMQQQPNDLAVELLIPY